MHDLFTVYIDSPTGPMEIISGPDKVTSINFIKNKQENTPGQQPACLQQCMLQLDEYFAGKRLHFDFPYEQPGTPFQQKVWKELEKIPCGTLITYTEQTRRLGDMKAIRAVASANGKNKLAIVVPCHRVLGSNGKLTGYAGGLDKKRWLIDHERQFAQPEEGKLF